MTARTAHDRASAPEPPDGLPDLPDLPDTRSGTAEPWQPTVAHVRATLVGITLIGIAVTTGRPDLLVIGAPFAIVAAWATVTRPTTQPTPFDRFGNATVREGDATTWRAAILDLDDADLVRVDIVPQMWIETAPISGSIAAPVTGGRADVDMTVRSTRWGRRIIDPVRFVAAGPWGGYQSSMTGAHRAIVTLPIPARFDTAAPMRPTDGLVGVSRSSRAGEGGEFAHIRDFAVGDRMRRINWPRSSRSGVLQVNATWADQDTHVALVLDASDDFGVSEGVDGNASSLDTTVRAAGAVAEYAARRGDRVSLRVFGSLGHHTLPAATGRRHVRRLLDLLTRVRPTGGSLTAHRGLAGQSWVATGAELTVVLSPLVSREALDRAVALGRHGVPVVVIDTLPDNLAVDADPYASLAWRIRLLERRREIRRVEAAGIPVVRWTGAGSLDRFLRDVARRATAPRIRNR